MEMFGKLIEKQPNLWAAPNNLAFILCDHGSGKKDIEKALSLAQKAQKLRPEEPAVLDTLGWVYFRKGDLAQASTFIGRAIEKAPDAPVINYHMGMVLYQQGRLGDAKEHLRKATQGGQDFSGKEEALKILATL
jgi:Flp pilus assembly protein TadD